jgi:hypothetical protein
LAIAVARVVVAGVFVAEVTGFAVIVAACGVLVLVFGLALVAAAAGMT